MIMVITITITTIIRVIRTTINNENNNNTIRTNDSSTKLNKTETIIHKLIHNNIILHAHYVMMKFELATLSAEVRMVRKS